jgi:5-methylcytosine-specific restriction endonuclease McrA
LKRGLVVPATVADHINPHDGDWNRFMLDPLQSLCASCHSSAKAIIDKRGYAVDIGPDGWPLDPKHPAYR